MANLRYVTARRNAMQDDVRAALAGGSIRVYSGPQPVNGDAALSGNTLLGTLGLASPAGAVSAGGVFTFGPITAGLGAAPGIAAWARMMQSDGATAVGDMDVGLSGATFILDSVNIVAGGNISATGVNTLSIPAT